MTTKVFLEFSAGNRTLFEQETNEFIFTQSFVQSNASNYGLPPNLKELSSDQMECIQSIWSHALFSPRFQPPNSLVLGRIDIELNPQAPKTMANFIALCTGSHGKSKLSSQASLHYQNIPMHRIIHEFIAQGGDVTRKDGSGGESIYKGTTFADEKSGFLKNWNQGVVAMANSGKNTNTSQFFICLSNDPTKYTKLVSKHVVIGKICKDENLVLQQLSIRGSKEGIPTEPVWISDCGICSSE